MPPFPKPLFPVPVDVATEIQALQHYRDTKPGRAIPAPADGQLRIATWNIANLGIQERRPEDYQIMAEMISWFDLITIQEVHDNLQGLRAIHDHLPTRYRLLFSDASGNDERIAFIYDALKMQLLEEVGEVAIPPSQLRYITIPASQQQFDGFDRNPFLATFQCDDFRFLLVSVHLFFGTSSAISKNRRLLETLAIARWIDLRQKSRSAYVPVTMAIGDFNLPKVDKDDPIYKALTDRGLQIPSHTTEVGSTITNDTHYDQIAFFPPSPTQNWYAGQTGVFDFDGAIFKEVWQSHTPEEFQMAVRYYLSDHRILWSLFRTRL